MTDILQMSKGGAKFYPQTHVQAVIGLPDFSTFEKASDVQTSISSAIKGIPPTDLSNYPTKTDVTNEIGTAVSKAKPDLSNYPTKTDVTTEISTAVSGIKPTDLSNYPTKPEMTTAINNAKPDLSSFVTMEQVQSAIDNSKIDVTKVGEVSD